MAERIARHHSAGAELTDVHITSAGTTAEELGNPMDRRAASTLRRHGYDASGHTARQITAQEIVSADLVIAMQELHVRQLRRIAQRDDLEHIRLLRCFDPQATTTEIPDPWYGNIEDFENTLTAIEQSMPGLIEYLKQSSDNAHLR